jgi:signal transduction histidine kinase
MLSYRFAFSLLVPLLLLLFFRLVPSADLALPLPLFHFYIVTFTTFAAAVISILLSAALEPVARLRHVLAAVAFAVMGAIFLLHGLATPGALLHNFHPAVPWSAWLTLLGGSLVFFLASLDGPQAAPTWLSLRKVVAVAAVAVSLYLAVVTLAPHWLAALDAEAAPWHRLLVFILTLLLWLWTAFRFGRIWRAGGGRVDGVLALVACWLALAAVSMHQFPLWHLSWWLYHFLLLAGFLLTIIVLLAEYEQARQFSLVRYYLAASLVVTAALALLGSDLFGRLSLQIVSQAAAEPAQLLLRLRLLSLAVAFVTMGTLFGALLLVVGRADRIMAARSAELSRAYRDLSRSEAVRQDLTSMIVHDLRTPLTSVIASLDLALHQDAAAGNHRLQSRARNAAVRMSDMIDDILTVSKFEAGELTLHPEKVCLPDFLNGRLDLFMAQITAEKKRLELECTADLFAWMDPALMGRVIENLVSNGLKYTQEGGRIAVSAREQGERLWFTVCDDGDGIPDAYKEAVFGKFTQAPPGEDRAKRQGTGLGLAFCRLAVEAHGGHIWVEDAAGGGSAFRFWLPAAQSPPGTLSASSS